MTVSKRSDQEDSPEDYLSPQDIRGWAEQEIKNAQRALALRIKELTDLSSAYSSGKLTAEQADQAHSHYYHRWGEALPGATASDSITDEEIMAQVDKASGQFLGPRQVEERYRRLFPKDKMR